MTRSIDTDQEIDVDEPPAQEEPVQNRSPQVMGGLGTMDIQYLLEQADRLPTPHFRERGLPGQQRHSERNDFNRRIGQFFWEQLRLMNASLPRVAGVCDLKVWELRHLLDGGAMSYYVYYKLIQVIGCDPLMPLDWETAYGRTGVEKLNSLIDTLDDVGLQFARDVIMAEHDR